MMEMSLLQLDLYAVVGGADDSLPYVEVLLILSHYFVYVI